MGGILEWGWDTRVGWVGYWLLGRILEWGGILEWGWDTDPLLLSDPKASPPGQDVPTSGDLPVQGEAAIINILKKNKKFI